MRRHIPNLLTAGRFFLAIGFFAVMESYTGPGSTLCGLVVLDLALWLFLVATLTDAIDGYLARRMGHLTTFGRIADPFVDKILVCGALIYFLGPPFFRVGPDGLSDNVSCWQRWMVVLILAREMLVTGMRTFVESKQVDFSAIWVGKAKLIAQFAAIAWGLIYARYFAFEPEPMQIAWFATQALVWSATLLTALSAVVYLRRARGLLASA